MPKFNIAVGANVRCYADTEIEAESLEAAQAVAEQMARDWPNCQPELVFDPEWDSMDDLEVLDVQTAEKLAEFRAGR